MLKILIWILAIPLSYFILSILGIICFEISLVFDKTDIELRRRNFNKIFVMIGWLMPFLFLIKLFRGGYKKRLGG